MEKIIFIHRDPAKIANGLHDYDLYLNGESIGKCRFNSMGMSAVNMTLTTTDDRIWNLPIREEIIDSKTNEEIFEIMQPEILSILQHNPK